MPRPIVLFYSPSMEPLARQISEISERHCGRKIELGEVTFPRFGDGWAHPIIKGANKLPNMDVAFLMSFDDAASAMYQLWAAEWMAGCGPHSLKLLLPYFPTATMERGETEDDVATAKTLMSMFRVIPPHARACLWMTDVHTLSLRNMAPSDHVSVQLDTAMNDLQELLDPSTTGIVWPDLGAKKRFEAMFKDRATGTSKFGFVTCDKQRIDDNADRETVVLEGSPWLYDEVIIVDDLTHSGKTLRRAKEAVERRCREKGKRAPRVGAHVSHLAPEPGALDYIRASGFSRFITTNSCPVAVAQTVGDPLFEHISLAPHAVRVIVRGIEGVEFKK